MMNRRQALLVGAGAVIAPVVTIAANKDDSEQEYYWRKQWLINEYEQELQDMRNHYFAVKAGNKYK
jgi:hypothetical protein